MKIKHVVIGVAAVGVSALLLAHKPGEPTVLPMIKGAINTAITQANINENICNTQWSTKNERPSSSYTTALKIKQLKP